MSDEPTSPSRSVLGVILLTVFLDLVGFSIIFPLFPDMLEYYLSKAPVGGGLHKFIDGLEWLSGMQGERATFAATVLFGGLLGSMYSALQFVAAPIWGAISDRNGRRPVLLVTVAGIALSYLLWVCADAFWLLVLSRLVGGVMAGNLSVATAAIADVTTRENRASGMGMVGAAFGIGFIIGPALGALLSIWDAREMFSFVPGINPFSFPAMVALGLSLINLLFVWTRLPETLPEQDAQSERPDAVHAKRPLNPLKLLAPSSLPGINRTNLVYFVFIAAFAGMEFTLTFLAKDRFGYSAYENGRLFLVFGLVAAVVQGGVVRRIAPKYGEARLVFFGMLLVLPGLVLVGASQTQWLMYVGILMLATGSSLVTPCLTSLISLYAPENRQGESLGVFRSLGSLARAMAPILGSFLYWRFGSQWPYYVSALVLVIPVFLVLRLPPTGGAASARAA